MAQELIVEREGAVTRLVLNRPALRNALSAGLVEALLTAFERAAGDGTRLLVLRGNGKAFCAGFDFTGLDGQSEGELVLRFVRIEQLLQAIHHAPFATLALAHGACFGAGADIFASCGRRIATAQTRFRMPGLRFGVVLGTRRLAELLGRDAARDLLQTTPVFDTRRALSLGLVQTIEEEQAWPDVVAQAATDSTTLPVDAQRALLSRTTFDERDADLAALVRSVATPGLRERIRDFLAQGKTQR